MPRSTRLRNRELHFALHGCRPLFAPQCAALQPGSAMQCTRPLFTCPRRRCCATQTKFQDREEGPGLSLYRGGSGNTERGRGCRACCNLVPERESQSRCCAKEGQANTLQVVAGSRIRWMEGHNKLHMQLAEEHKTRQVKVGPGGQACQVHIERVVGRKWHSRGSAKGSEPSKHANT